MYRNVNTLRCGVRKSKIIFAKRFQCFLHIPINHPLCMRFVT